MEQGKFLTVKEAATYLRLKPLALYRMVEKKKIPFRKAGRSIRFIQSELDIWLKWGSL
jgi:excisionase family DNA binding protein